MICGFSDIKVVSFDIGNTLIDLKETIGFSTYFCQKTNCKLDDIREIVNEYFLKKDISMEMAITSACKILGINNFNSLINDYKQVAPVLFDDVLFTLKKLKKLGYIIIACSNCTKWDAENSNEELKKSIDCFFYSFKLGSVKPEKKYFEIVQQTLNVPSNQILHIGDTLYADYYGALHAGWKAVLLDRNEYGLLMNDNIQRIMSLKDVFI